MMIMFLTIILVNHAEIVEIVNHNEEINQFVSDRDKKFYKKHPFLVSTQVFTNNEKF